MKRTLEHATWRHQAWGYLYNASVSGVISSSKQRVDLIKHTWGGNMSHGPYDHLPLSRLCYNPNNHQPHFRQRPLWREAGRVRYAYRRPRVWRHFFFQLQMQSIFWKYSWLQLPAGKKWGWGVSREQQRKIGYTETANSGEAHEWEIKFYLWNQSPQEMTHGSQRHESPCMMRGDAWWTILTTYWAT